MHEITVIINYVRVVVVLIKNTVCKLCFEKCLALGCLLRFSLLVHEVG